MNRFSIHVLSWAALLGAVAMWAGVALFAWMIAAERSERISRIENSAQESVQRSALQKLHALARDTREERGLLETLAQSDISDILDTIEAVGRDAGVSIEIGQASTGAAPTEESSLQTTALLFSAEGTFSKLSQVAALVQVFPLPALVDEVQFERIESASTKAPPWRINVRMRVFTTAELST